MRRQRASVRIAGMAGSVDRYSWAQVEWPTAYETGADLWKRTDYQGRY